MEFINLLFEELEKENSQDSILTDSFLNYISHHYSSYSNNLLQKQNKTNFQNDKYTIEKKKEENYQNLLYFLQKIEEFFNNDKFTDENRKIKIFLLIRIILYTNINDIYDSPFLINPYELLNNDKFILSEVDKDKLHKIEQIIDDNNNIKLLCFDTYIPTDEDNSFSVAYEYNDMLKSLKNMKKSTTVSDFLLSILLMLLDDNDITELFSTNNYEYLRQLSIDIYNKIGEIQKSFPYSINIVLNRYNFKFDDKMINNINNRSHILLFYILFFLINFERYINSLICVDLKDIDSFYEKLITLTENDIKTAKSSFNLEYFVNFYLNNLYTKLIIDKKQLNYDFEIFIYNDIINNRNISNYYSKNNTNVENIIVDNIIQTKNINIFENLNLISDDIKKLVNNKCHDILKYMLRFFKYSNINYKNYLNNVEIDKIIDFFINHSSSSSETIYEDFLINYINDEIIDPNDNNFGHGYLNVNISISSIDDLITENENFMKQLDDFSNYSATKNFLFVANNVILTIYLNYNNNRYVLPLIIQNDKKNTDFYIEIINPFLEDEIFNIINKMIDELIIPFIRNNNILENNSTKKNINIIKIDKTKISNKIKNYKPFVYLLAYILLRKIYNLYQISDIDLLINIINDYLESFNDANYFNLSLLVFTILCMYENLYSDILIYGYNEDDDILKKYDINILANVKTKDLKYFNYLLEYNNLKITGKKINNEGEKKDIDTIINIFFNNFSAVDIKNFNHDDTYHLDLIFENKDYDDEMKYHIIEYFISKFFHLYMINSHGYSNIKFFNNKFFYYSMILYLCSHKIKKNNSIDLNYFVYVFLFNKQSVLFKWFNDMIKNFKIKNKSISILKVDYFIDNSGKKIKNHLSNFNLNKKYNIVDIILAFMLYYTNLNDITQAFNEDNDNINIIDNTNNLLTFNVYTIADRFELLELFDYTKPLSLFCLINGKHILNHRKDYRNNKYFLKLLTFNYLTTFNANLLFSPYDTYNYDFRYYKDKFSKIMKDQTIPKFYDKLRLFIKEFENDIANTNENQHYFNLLTDNETNEDLIQKYKKFYNIDYMYLKKVTNLNIKFNKIMNVFANYFHDLIKNSDFDKIFLIKNYTQKRPLLYDFNYQFNPIKKLTDNIYYGINVRGLVLNSFNYYSELSHFKTRHFGHIRFKINKTLSNVEIYNNFKTIFEEYVTYFKSIKIYNKYDDKHNIILPDIIIHLTIGEIQQSHSSIIIIHIPEHRENFDMNENFVDFYNPWTYINENDNNNDNNCIVNISIMISDFLRSKDFVDIINKVFYDNCEIIKMNYYKFYTSNNIQFLQNEVENTYRGMCALHSLIYGFARIKEYKNGNYSMNYVQKQINDYLFKITHPVYFYLAFQFYYIIFSLYIKKTAKIYSTGYKLSNYNFFTKDDTSLFFKKMIDIMFSPYGTTDKIIDDKKIAEIYSKYDDI